MSISFNAVIPVPTILRKNQLLVDITDLGSTAAIRHCFCQLVQKLDLTDVTKIKIIGVNTNVDLQAFKQCKTELKEIKLVSRITGINIIGKQALTAKFPNIEITVAETPTACFTHRENITSKVNSWRKAS